MEWIKSILEKHTGEDGKLDFEGAIKAINKAAPENVVPKEQYNTLSESKKQLETTVSERDKQLETLKAAGSVEDLQGKITELQTENETTKKEYDAKIADMLYDKEIEQAFANAFHPELLNGKIDRTKLSIKDGKVEGLEEQATALKTTYKDQFKPDKTGKKPANPETGNGEITKEQFNKMGYNDRAKLYSENKELYDQLTGGNE